MEEKKKAWTLCGQSGRILLMIPTAVATLTVAVATLVMEYTKGLGNYIIARDLAVAAGCMLLSMLPAFVASALWGKPICKMDEDGFLLKERRIRFMDIERMEYVYGYTRYYGDHTVFKLFLVNGETVSLKRGPIWLPLFVRRYTKEFTVSYPHLKRHFLKGFIAGLIISILVVGIYFL